MKNVLTSIVDWFKDVCNPDMTAEQVAAVLQSRADAIPGKLDWPGSIVDLLKVMQMPSDYGARKQLADDLGIDGYTGSPEQNIRMHELLVEEIGKYKIKMPPVVEA